MKIAKWFSFAVSAVITLIFLTPAIQAGDKEDDQKLFDKVSSRLEKGGSYFNFQSSKYIFRAIEDTYRQIPNAIKVIVPDPMEQMLPMMVYNSLAPVVKSLGIDEMLAAGASSVIIAEKNGDKPALFRSRQFIYYGPEKPDGIFWDLIAGENHQLDLSELPKETLFASAYRIEPGKIWEKLKLLFAKFPVLPAQEIPQLAEQKFFASFNVKLSDFLDSLNGRYSSLIVSARTAEGKPALYAMLKAPNKDGLAFKVLSELAKSQPLFQVLPDEIKTTMPPLLTWLKPAVRKDDKNIFIVSNPQILNIVKETVEKKDGLAAGDEFKYLSQGLSQNGIAFIYFSSRTIATIIDLVKTTAGQDDRDWSVFAKLIPPSDFFLVISREEDGIMGTVNSPMDFPQFIAYSSVLPSAMQIVGPILNHAGAISMPRRTSSADRLKQIGLAMKMYAMDHKDKYPAGDNVAGLNELVKEDYLADVSVYIKPDSKNAKDARELNEADSSYIYFGGFVEDEGANIPVAFDKFNKNRNIINVLYQDGRVAPLPGKLNSCGELVDYLAKTGKFKPEILKKLQEKARKIDKELGYK
jgi:hypothetical protein